MRCSCVVPLTHQCTIPNTYNSVICTTYLSYKKTTYVHRRSPNSSAPKSSPPSPLTKNTHSHPSPSSPFVRKITGSSPKHNEHICVVFTDFTCFLFMLLTGSFSLASFWCLEAFQVLLLFLFLRYPWETGNCNLKRKITLLHEIETLILHRFNYYFLVCTSNYRMCEYISWYLLSTKMNLEMCNTLSKCKSRTGGLIQ